MPHKWEQDLEKVKKALEDVYPQELTRAKLAQRCGRPITAVSTACVRLLDTGEITKRREGQWGYYYSRDPDTRT